MKRLISGIIFILLATPARPQFTDSTMHFFSYGATGVMNKTNDGRSYVLNNNFRFSIRKKRVSLNSAAGWIYGENNNNKTNNDFNAALDFNIFPDSSKIYYWGLVTYDKSFSLKITDRVQVGAGIAYNVIESPQLFINVSDGILFENSDLFLNATTRDAYTTFRNSFRLRYRWSIRDRFVLEGTHFVQNSLRESSDYTIKSNTALSVKLKKWLSFSTALTYNKLNRTKRENLLLTFGLTVETYF